MPMQIHVYGKPGCSLCEDALELLEDKHPRFRFEVVLHNILEEPALFEKYRYDVPVLVIEGIERLRLRFDSEELEVVLTLSQVPRRE